MDEHVFIVNGEIVSDNTRKCKLSFIFRNVRTKRIIRTITSMIEINNLFIDEVS